MTQPQTVWAVEGADLPEGPCDLMKIGHEDGGVTRLAKWPEGLVLWHEGEIVWRQWVPKPSSAAARPPGTIWALRSAAAAYEESAKDATADLLREAANMIESLTALLADPDIVRQH